MSDTKDPAVKLIGGLLLLLAAAVGWYTRELTTEVRELRAELRSATAALTRVQTVLEIQAGGDPYREE